jgi:hypothetical protein
MRFWENNERLFNLYKGEVGVALSLKERDIWVGDCDVHTWSVLTARLEVYGLTTTRPKKKNILSGS